MTVLRSRVERLMVLLPTRTMSESPESVLTTLLALSLLRVLLAGARVLVETCDVTVEPSWFVVVTATVVGTLVLSSTAGEEPGDASVFASLVGSAVSACVVVPGSAVVAALVGVSLVTGSSDVVGFVVGSVEGSSVVGVSLVVGGSVVMDVSLVDTPVPTTCRLLGMMPSGMISARICAKPRRRESMMADACGRIEPTILRASLAD